MKKFHSHHTTPVHKGGKDSPQVLLLDYDHAQLHYERFVNGDDNWFHAGLLFLLEPEQQLHVRRLYSEKMSGEGNHMFGVEPTIKGWNWWTDGTNNVLSDKQPGPDFKLGRTVSWSHPGSVGKTWFNDGTKEVLSGEQPEGFKPGRLPGQTRDSSSRFGKVWFNDGTEEVQTYEQPEGFVPGRLPRKGKQVKLLDTLTKETLHFESLKDCYTFLGVTKKVFDNRRHKNKLINSRYLVN